MNLYQLVIKQMRQRALSTWLTLLSVLLGVGLATATLIAQREGDSLFRQTDFGYNLIVGPKGSKLGLVLNTVYHVTDSQGTIPFSVYDSLRQNRAIEWAVPLAVGDNYEGFPLIGTSTTLFGLSETGQSLAENSIPMYRLGRRFEMAEGKSFHPLKFEAVIGFEVARRTGLKLGSKIRAEHGTTKAKMYKDEHTEEWTVVGILQPTRTANDSSIFIPLVSFYAIPSHGEGLEEMAGKPTPATKPHDDHDHPATQPDDHDDHAGEPGEHAGHDHDHVYHLNPDGTIELHVPKTAWRVSAVLVRAKGVWAAILDRQINNTDYAMAVAPGMEMANFFQTFFNTGAQVLLAISIMVSVVAAVSILVSIYNSIAARRREIAILRALGATRNRVLLLICTEAGLIGLLGGIAGIVVGHAIAGVGSIYMSNLLGEGIHWLAYDPHIALYLAGVVVLAVIAGLIPALKAYTTPVATHLVAT